VPADVQCPKSHINNQRMPIRFLLQFLRQLRRLHRLRRYPRIGRRGSYNLHQRQRCKRGPPKQDGVIFSC